MRVGLGLGLMPVKGAAKLKIHVSGMEATHGPAVQRSCKTTVACFPDMRTEPHYDIGGAPATTTAAVNQFQGYDFTYEWSHKLGGWGCVRNMRSCCSSLGEVRLFVCVWRLDQNTMRTIGMVWVTRRETQTDPAI